MYAKLCNIEILSSYIKEVSVGDLLTVQALVTNPLDWHHFYEKISTIKKGDRTDFTVVTPEGDRLVGSGDIIEVDKWSNHGHYGFKIKVDVKRQKSLTDRRIRGPGRTKPRGKDVTITPTLEVAQMAAPSTTTAAMMITSKDIADLLKGSVTTDMV
ncbi:MAG TPA: hypothetical protein VNI77_09560 [Nitrososphaera sp.]|nr:hypothetical protein [Nitrososphaera sp.]